MMLADLGADVVRVRRPGGVAMPSEDRDLLHRGKRIVDLDVKAQPEALLGLAARADVLLDCFRPGRASDSASVPTTARRSIAG